MVEGRGARVRMGERVGHITYKKGVSGGGRWKKALGPLVRKFCTKSTILSIIPAMPIYGSQSI